MTWTSRIPVVTEAFDRAVKDGLTAGATLYANAEKEALTGGYTSGAFVTGNVRSSVTVIPAAKTATGYEAKVGTNVMYALFWEIGHHNLFTRRFERVETWRPVLLDNASRIHQRIWDVASARIRAMGTA